MPTEVLSLSELPFHNYGIPNKRILRNLPYAHRGYVFKDQKLAAYFKSLWWYMPDPNWQQDTSDFTEEEWKLIREAKEE